MPNFETYVDLDVDDFISNCDTRDIKEMIKILKDDGHLPHHLPINDKMTFLEEKFVNKMSELSSHYVRLSREDEEVLEKLFKKYC